MNRRAYWTLSLQQISHPVLSHLAQGTLHRSMPVESNGGNNLAIYSCLEALGRSLAGIAPWLELCETESAPTADLARRAIANAVDPASPDSCNFSRGQQPLVDAAFLAQGLLRAPSALLAGLSPETRTQLESAFRSTRRIIPYHCNWILFSAMVETALFRMGSPDWDGMRIACVLRQYEAWYKGDGLYGDGAEFHMDYYNSFVIQPMLVDIITAMKGQIEDAARMEERIISRSVRYATILERMISPEGTFPPLGRSLAYRFGALQSLAQTALLKKLPDEISPSQVREALTAVLRRFMESSSIFDSEGWLRIGLGGHQPGLGEHYINTGSLYMFTLGFLPLGLPSSDAFWADPPHPWTSVKAWSGLSTPIDSALHG